MSRKNTQSIALRRSVAVVGEGETESLYFNSVRKSMMVGFKLVTDVPRHPDIKEIRACADRLLKDGFDCVVVLVDMDRYRANAKEMETYKRAKAALERRGVMVLETFPCTEFWFLLHFLPNGRRCLHKDCEDVVRELRKYLPDYEKKRKYLSSIYQRLSEKGDLARARRSAKDTSEWVRREGIDADFSELYKLFDLLDEIRGEKKERT